MLVTSSVLLSPLPCCPSDPSHTRHSFPNPRNCHRSSVGFPLLSSLHPWNRMPVILLSTRPRLASLTIYSSPPRSVALGSFTLLTSSLLATRCMVRGVNDTSEEGTTEARIRLAKRLRDKDNSRIGRYFRLVGFFPRSSLRSLCSPLVLTVHSWLTSFTP